MSDTLSTQNLEPGFFSQVREDANLQLPPVVSNVVAIMGEGVAQQSTVVTITPALNAGATARTADYDLLGDEIEDFGGFNETQAMFPSTYGFGMIGPTGVNGVGATALAGKTFSFVVAGTTFDIGLTGCTMASNIVAAINGHTGVTGANTVVWAFASGPTGTVGLATKNGEPDLQILSCLGNNYMGFATDQRPNLIYWHDDPDSAVSYGLLDPYQVVFHVASTDLTPRYFYSKESVYADFGQPSAANSLSLGAKGAFDEGADVVLCRMFDPAEMGGTGAAAEVQAAFADFEKYKCSIVVPMIPANDTGYTTLCVDALQHVSTMSNKINRKERIAILGVDETASQLATTGATNSWQALMSTFASVSEASGLKTNRIVVMNPGMVYTTLDGVATQVPGTYLAACMAGRLVNSMYDEATPMTRKPFTSVAALYESVSDEKTRVEKNTLSNSYGVTVVEMSGSIAIIRRAVTANISTIASQEISIVRPADRVASDLRTLLEGQYVGIKIVTDTAARIEASVGKYLRQMVENQVIGNYRGVKAVVNTTDPRQFDISFEIIPVFPLLWGFVDISITLK